MTNFEQWPLDARIGKAIADLGFTETTPVQNAVIPLALAERDVVGLAQTGTGKTAAFAVPVLQHWLQGEPGALPQVLIVVPTRELADQVYRDLLDLGKYTAIRALTLYGGVNINPQINSLAEGVDVLVACPGRLMDHMERGTVDLSQITTLVIDEADRMLDMGFLPDVRRIVRDLPPKRQTMLFSATMPEDVRDLADAVLRQPETVDLQANMPVDTITHVLFPVNEAQKPDLLIEILYREQKTVRSVLIFANTKARVRKVYEHLKDYGHNVAVLEGDLTQHRRTKAIEGFREGHIKILVATDIAARGLDISQVSHVINYDFPQDRDAYIHRVGRTGRAQRSGLAYTFITPRQRQLADALQDLLDHRPEFRKLKGFPYQAAPRQQRPSGERNRRDRR